MGILLSNTCQKDTHSCLAEKLLNCRKVSIAPAMCEDLASGGRRQDRLERTKQEVGDILGKTIAFDDVCIMFGLRRLLGLITGLHAIIIYLVRSAIF